MNGKFILKLCLLCTDWITDSPFLCWLKPLHQIEAWCRTIYVKMSFMCMWMKSHFHNECSWMRTNTGFGKEAKGYSEMDHSCSALLRWFPSFALRIPTAHDFCVISARNERARVQNVRDFPQTKLDGEVNARFLLNEHGNPHFLFYKFNENNIRNNWEKNWQKSMATFLVKEVNATDRDNGPNRANPNYVSFKG